MAIESNSSGIYKIVNTETNKVYIGSCLNFHKRALKHFNELSRNKHANQHLQNAYNLYGKSTFIFEVIRECSREDLIKCEQEQLDLFHPNSLYNIRLLAQSNLGLKMSEETKKKMSNSAKNKEFSVEHKRNLSIAKRGFAPMKGRKFTKEHADKIKQASCKSVYCPELDMVFNSLTEASLYVGASVGSICQSLSKGTRVKRLYSFKYRVL